MTDVAADVLVVDDTEISARFLQTLLELDGHVVRIASDGAAALRLVRAEPPDLILMDAMMPIMDGFQACRALKQDLFTRSIPVVLCTALDDTPSRLRGIESGADDFISKPFNAAELRARVRSLLRIKHYTDDLDRADSVIVSLALTIEARDASTAGHCERLAGYSCALGRALGFDESDVRALARGAFIHDVGKVGIPEAVWMKSGTLTHDEYELIKQHAVIGDQLCGELRSLQSVRPIVRHHHERLDGSGYPDGLCNGSIPLLAQVMGIADVFDALTTRRSYRGELSFAEAASVLQAEAERGWRNAELVGTFLALPATRRPD